jgi:hypothetical protein
MKTGRSSGDHKDRGNESVKTICTKIKAYAKLKAQRPRLDTHTTEISILFPFFVCLWQLTMIRH